MCPASVAITIYSPHGIDRALEQSLPTFRSAPSERCFVRSETLLNRLRIFLDLIIASSSPTIGSSTNNELSLALSGMDFFDIVSPVLVSSIVSLPVKNRP